MKARASVTIVKRDSSRRNSVTAEMRIKVTPMKKLETLFVMALRFDDSWGKVNERSVRSSREAKGGRDGWEERLSRNVGVEHCLL